MCIPCCFTVSTAEVALIERWGKFHRLAQVRKKRCGSRFPQEFPGKKNNTSHLDYFALQPGFNITFCPCEQQVGRLSFRVQQLNVRVETKTLDNVFLEAVVSVQYQVLRDKCYEAFYALTNPVQQITAHVYDVCNYTRLTANQTVTTAFSHDARFSLCR
jgi:regulator of protease activity HflC (stomatin/prohibitin superfamily)